MKRLALSLSLSIAIAQAGEVRVLAVDITPNRDGSHDFAVTLRHADQGWEHYADRWEILAPDGESLAARVLYHPHVHEQPFTRGLRRVRLPAGIERVQIRAHDKRHGWGKALEVRVPGRIPTSLNKR